MAEYIERSRITDVLLNNTSLEGYDLEEAVNAICAIPAADVRPVVLCRDCIYAPIGNHDGADLEWPRDDFPERNSCPLKCEDRWYSRKPAPDFYCANGVKRSRNE